MIKRTIENFSIAQICESGQCFRMEEIGKDRYRILAADRYLEIEQHGADCCFYCTEQEFDTFWRNYFDLDVDYSRYLEKIDPTDRYLVNASRFGSGLRILRQDLWEMIASFLISQRNNIRRIRRCIDNICRTYGEERMSENGTVYYAFPTPEVLACLDEDELKKCNLGYRSKYVVRTAKSIVAQEIDLTCILSASYKEAQAELLKLFGVGVKVADCICLFGLHRLEAFPVDTHIQQALDRCYPEGFPFARYEGCQGVMQQYIFYWELLGKERT